MANPTFAPGFRLSIVDLLVVILGALLSVALAFIDPGLPDWWEANAQPP